MLRHYYRGAALHWEHMPKTRQSPRAAAQTHALAHGNFFQHAPKTWWPLCPAAQTEAIANGAPEIFQSFCLGVEPPTFCLLGDD